MSIKKLEIKGLRSFCDEEKINFAIPNGKPGSGLTVIVGANNSGKSSIIECLNILVKNKNVFPEELRNKNTEGLSYIKVETDRKRYEMINDKGEHALVRKYVDDEKREEFDRNDLPILIYSTKRFFSSNFNNMRRNILDYSKDVTTEFRTDNYVSNMFGERIIDIYRGNNLNSYKKELKYILPNIPEWEIEALDDNNYYLKFIENNSTHNSSAAGSGVNNIFLIIDSYLSTTEEQTIVIDEPELSLHPDVQQRILSRLIEISKNKQVIITTHSPYFVDYNILENDGKIMRAVNKDNQTRIYCLDENDYENIKSLIDDSNNPHILGTTSKEILFLNDNILLVEGQEDVVCYKKIFENEGFTDYPAFFGWGSGGYPKINNIIQLLNNLGYEKVFCIADGDEAAKGAIDSIKNNYPNYMFYNIAAEDIRDKNLSDKEKKHIEILSEYNDERLTPIIDYFNNQVRKGLVESKKTCEVKEEFKNDIKELIEKIKDYFELNEKPELPLPIEVVEENVNFIELNSLMDIIIAQVNPSFDKGNISGIGSHDKIEDQEHIYITEHSGFSNIVNEEISVTQTVAISKIKKEIIECNVSIEYNEDSDIKDRIQNQLTKMLNVMNKVK